MSKHTPRKAPAQLVPVQPAQIVPTQEDSILLAILEASKNPATNPEIMRQMFDLHVALMDKKAEIEFNKAIALVEQSLPTITKNKTANITRRDGSAGYEYNYSDLANIDEKIRPILRTHKFSLSFDTTYENGFAIYFGTLTHEQGHKRTAHIRLPDDRSGGKNELQAVGSTKSYARRYLVMDLLNIVTADADTDGVTEGKKISAAQIEYIDRSIDGENIDRDKFLALMAERFGVDTIGDIPLQGLPEIQQMINTRQRTNKHPFTKAPK